MKTSTRIVITMLLGSSLTSIATQSLVTPLKNDREAYNYCINHKHAFIAIVWPIAKGHQDKIVAVLSKYGEIQYYKPRLLNKKEAVMLLEMSHTSVPSFLMAAHVTWYFPKGSWQNPARIFVMRFKNADVAVACKQEIRKFFDLSYRAIHTTDDQKDTIELAEFFFKNKRKSMSFAALFAQFEGDGEDALEVVA